MSLTPPPRGLLDSPARLLLPEGGLRREVDRSLIEIAGPDAVGFLQRICAQDVAAVPPGGVTPTAFLSSKGKLVAVALAIRFEDRVLLDTASRGANALAELCELYHFTEKLSIARRDGLRAMEWVGAEPLSQGAPFTAVADGDGVTHTTLRGGLWRTRAFAAADRIESCFAGVPELGPALAECLRIATGEVEVGVDTDERTLVLEAGLDDHVSTHKGCYVGQEIVARIHTYGHLNRRLVRLAIATTAPIASGSALFDIDLGEPVGRVMSSCRVPDTEWSIALGYLPEALLVEPTLLALGTADGPAVHHAGLVPA